MKSMSTRLTERAMSRHEMPQDPLALLRESAAEQLGVPVIAAALFSRQISQIASWVVDSPSVGGPLAQLALRKYEQRQAGGLPMHFLVAVTSEEVIALERKVKARSWDGVGVAGPEVARWRRADLEITVEDKGHKLNVTLSSPTEDEKVKCTVGKIAATEDFVALLGDPSRQTPATKSRVEAA